MDVGWVKGGDKHENKREKALDLLKTYSMFDDEEMQVLWEHITSISVSNKSTSLDFTILANGCAIC